MNIYLVRHTQYYNPENIYAFFLPLYLSTTGRKRANLLASWFVKKEMLELPIYTSPIVRCLQTAEIIASKTKSFVAIDQRLTEVSCPNLQGVKKPKKDDWKLEEDDQTRETHLSTRKRILDLYNQKVKEGKDCIFVSHGEPLTILQFYLQNKKLPQYLWNDENKENVIQKGNIVEILITDSLASSMQKFMVRPK